MKVRKAYCYDCGKTYGEEDWIEAVIPDKIWIKISPYKNQGGILCISCIARRLIKVGYKNVPVWMCGTEPLKAMAGDPNDNLELLRNYKQTS